jgi:hypothetical protein
VLAGKINAVIKAHPVRRDDEEKELLAGFS